MKQAVLSILNISSGKEIPSILADFGNKLVGVRPGTVFDSISWKLLSLSLIKSTLPHPEQPKQEKACQAKFLMSDNSCVVSLDS